MNTILSLQRLHASSSSIEQLDDSPATSNVSIHCSGVQDSTQSYYCTGETTLDLG